MKLSVVTTIYKTAGQMEEFFRRSVAAADEMGVDNVEVVFVNDGSPDNAIEVARRLIERDSRAIMVDLAHNVGQHRALWFGLQLASGDLVAMMDGDLEEDPLWLPRFRQVMIQTDSDLVFGVQTLKRKSALYRFCRSAFYKLLATLTASDFPANVVTARLMTKRYVTALKEYSEREIFLVGIMHMVGFARTSIEVEKHELRKSSYSLMALVRIFVTHTTSFSIAPLLAIFIIGLLLITLATLGTAILTIAWFYKSLAAPGWLSTILTIAFFSGMNLFFTGIVAIYLGTVFLEVKRRPIATIRKIYKRQGDEA